MRRFHWSISPGFLGDHILMLDTPWLHFRWWLRGGGNWWRHPFSISRRYTQLTVCVLWFGFAAMEYHRELPVKR